MPKITKRTEAIRVGQASAVLELNKAGVTIVEACEQIGIPVSTYRFWVAKAAEALNNIQAARSELDRVNLLTFILSRQDAITNLTNLAASPKLEVFDLLSILNYYDRRISELSKEYVPSDRSAIKDLLTGPELRQAPNRFHQTNLEASLGDGLTIETFSDGSVSISPKRSDIIDVTPTEKEDDY